MFGVFCTSFFEALEIIRYNLDRVIKSGDNYNLSADFFGNSSHIMAEVGLVWLGLFSKISSF